MYECGLSSCVRRLRLVLHINYMETPNSGWNWPLKYRSCSVAQQSGAEWGQNGDPVPACVSVGRKDNLINNFVPPIEVFHAHSRVHGHHIIRYFLALHDRGAIQLNFQSLQARGIPVGVVPS